MADKSRVTVSGVFNCIMSFLPDDNGNGRNSVAPSRAGAERIQYVNLREFDVDYPAVIRLEIPVSLAPAFEVGKTYEVDLVAAPKSKAVDVAPGVTPKNETLFRVSEMNVFPVTVSVVRSAVPASAEKKVPAKS